MRKLKHTVLAVIVLSITTMALLFYQGILWFNAPSVSKYPIRGIDVSHHQDTINWEVLTKKENIAFAYIKATEGTNYQDPLYNFNNSQANKYGLKTGAYHYYRFCKPGYEQAINFINKVNPNEMSLPPAIDLEFMENCDSIPDIKNLEEELKEYIAIISDHYDKQPLIYLTMESFNQIYIKTDLDLDIWIRNVITSARLPKDYQWLFWQYSPRGNLEGIRSFVDLNVYCCDSL